MRCPFILSSKASSWLIKGHSTGSHSAWQPWLQLDNQSDRAMLLQDIESCYILRARSHHAGSAAHFTAACPSTRQRTAGISARTLSHCAKPGTVQLSAIVSASRSAGSIEQLQFILPCTNRLPCCCTLQPKTAGGSWIKGTWPAN